MRARLHLRARVPHRLARKTIVVGTLSDARALQLGGRLGAAPCPVLAGQMVEDHNLERRHEASMTVPGETGRPSRNHPGRAVAWNWPPRLEGAITGVGRSRWPPGLIARLDASKRRAP
jgi:hypothetical protein